MEHIQLHKFCLRKFHGYKLVEQTLGTKMETNSENFQSQTKFRTIEQNKFY